MTRLTLTLVAAATALAAGVATAPPTTASPTGVGAPQRSCARSADFNKLRNGMPKAKVAALLHNKGKRDVISKSGGYSFEIRTYRTCGQFDVISVGFENGRLSSKTGVFS